MTGGGKSEKRLNVRERVVICCGAEKQTGNETYAELDGVVLLARKVDTFGLVRHQRQICLLLIMPVQVIELILDLMRFR